MKKLNKENFFLTGAGQSAPIIYYYHTMAAAQPVKADFVVLNNDGTSEWFVSKNKIIVAHKNWLLSVTNKKLRGVFENWRKRWSAYNEEFYKMATRGRGSWREDWGWLDKIIYRYWSDPHTYIIEMIDFFADEIEKTILAKMRCVGLAKELLPEFISPAEPTLTQKIILERENVRRGLLGENKYIKKYWYCNGTWNGGLLLTKESLRRNLKEKIVKADFEKRKKLHLKLASKIDRQTLNIIENLRLLTLWREERKSFMQKINLGYVGVLERAEKEIGLPKKIIAWARPEEIGLLLKNQDLFEQRRAKSVYYYEFGKKKPVFITGLEADKIIAEFSAVPLIRELKGMIASAGRVKGRVKIILKEHQFNKFEDKEILVTTMTRPEFIPIVRKASAIITDEGGLTSHAAIVSRELGIPCIIGTKIATRVLKDGQLVEVDANKGMVRILKA